MGGKISFLAADLCFDFHRMEEISCDLLSQAIIVLMFLEFFQLLV